MYPNLIDDVILSFQVLNRLSIYGSIFKADGTWNSGLIKNNLIDALGEVKIELRLVLVIELCVYLLC